MRNNEERLGINPIRQDAAPAPQQLEQPQQKSIGLDFVIPTEFVPLPSKGKFYPLNHPLRDKDSIEIKQMTAKEEDILTSRSLLKKGMALDKLIASLIVDKTINTDTITSEDRNAILVAARVTSYGAEYNTAVTCPSCNEKIKYTFNLAEKLDQQEEKEPPAVVVDDRGYFTINLPVSKFRVVCRALNGFDEKAVFRNSETKKNVVGGDSVLLEQLKGMIVSINEVEDKALIKKAVEVLPASDSRFLRKSYVEAVPSVDLKKSFSCSSCDYETEMEVPLTADFFWFK